MEQAKIIDTFRTYQVSNDKSEHKWYCNAWKQGLGFILSLVATLNNINIIETHDISSKSMQGRCYSEIILFVDQKRMRIVQGYKSTPQSLYSAYMDTPISPQASKYSTNKHHNISLEQSLSNITKCPSCHRSTMKIILNTSIKSTQFHYSIHNKEE